MQRRSFIKTSASAATLVSLGAFGVGCNNTKKQLTILHTNDVHSHIDPFSSKHAQYANLGGIARRANLVAEIRTENPNTLLFDAGDIFQGTPYFNFYGGELEYKLMSMLKYDAATLGNHDFDNGIGGVIAQLPHASFKLISANYDFKNTLLHEFVSPYELYFVDGIKIGVYGIGIKLDGLVDKKLFKETKYLPPYEVAQDTENHLKLKEKCDLVICLSHLGYSYIDPLIPQDVKLAEHTQFTDLIIGGHTHTFLDKPTVLLNKIGREILVNQVGCYGIRLGRIDFYFDTTGIETSGVSIEV